MSLRHTTMSENSQRLELEAALVLALYSSSSYFQDRGDALCHVVAPPNAPIMSWKCNK